MYLINWVWNKEQFQVTDVIDKLKRASLWMNIIFPPTKLSLLYSLFALQDLPAGGPLWAGGAGDGRPADDRHEQTQRDLLHPVQRGHHVAERAGEWSVD